MKSIENGMRFLCGETHMLTGICAAYGTGSSHEALLHGNARELQMISGRLESDPAPLGTDSIYDLASLSKVFIAVLIMMLSERGMLDLNETIGRIDSRFVHLKDTTVFDVLCFRACLQTPERIDDAPTREEGLRRLFECRTAELPRIRIYSDINAMILKYIIEEKTGLPYSDAVRRMILQPAGMNETFSQVPADMKPRCVCYNYEHRITGDSYLLRTDVPAGTAHDPKALRLSDGGSDLCGHAGIFSTCKDMVRLAQALLCGELLSHESLLEIGKNRTGMAHDDQTYRQYLGFQCFTKHPLQRLSEVPSWMSGASIALSGFTGNHLSIDPIQGLFVIFLGNRCHGRVSHITPPRGETVEKYGLRSDGTGFVPWPDGRLVPSSSGYVYFKDAHLHAPIRERMERLGWLHASRV